MHVPRLRTLAETNTVALLHLLKYPHDPFLMSEQNTLAESQMCPAAVAVFYQHGTVGKVMVVPWPEVPTRPTDYGRQAGSLALQPYDSALVPPIGSPAHEPLQVQAPRLFPPPAIDSRLRCTK